MQRLPDWYGLGSMKGQRARQLTNGAARTRTASAPSARTSKAVCAGTGPFTTTAWTSAVERHQRPFLARAAAERGVSLHDYVLLLRDRVTQLLVDASPYIRMPTAALGCVLRDGRFKSQFETGTSSGLLDTTRRADLEQRIFGIPLDAACETRPIYGYLAVDPTRTGFLWRQDRSAPHVVVQLQPEVLDRTSVVMTDTLGIHPSPARLSIARVAPTHPHEPTHLCVPAEIPQLPDGSPAIESVDVLAIQCIDQVQPYAEAQFHGGVSRSDIARVLVRGSCPTEVLDSLDVLSIPWEALQ